MEKVASELHEHHVFEVELENLLGAQGPVKHPRVLAKVIPNQICRCTVIIIIDNFFYSTFSDKTMIVTSFR